ncbi:MAG: hypothetical protein ACR2O8_05550 [Rhizobiaceae bacterium]
MEIKSCEIDEQKIEEAVRFAISKQFCLDELSRLLVMEGGVDLDTLSRIIRENRNHGVEQQTIEPVSMQRSDKNTTFAESWSDLQKAS